MAEHLMHVAKKVGSEQVQLGLGGVVTRMVRRLWEVYANMGYGPPGKVHRQNVSGIPPYNAQVAYCLQDHAAEDAVHAVVLHHIHVSGL